MVRSQLFMGSACIILTYRVSFRLRDPEKKINQIEGILLLAHDIYFFLRKLSSPSWLERVPWWEEKAAVVAKRLPAAPDRAMALLHCSHTPQHFTMLSSHTPC